LAPRRNIYISTSRHLEPHIRSMVPDVNYMVEPLARNTAACIGLSALRILLDDPDAVMVVETADHVYADAGAYIRHLQAGIGMAKEDRIVLIGIKPSFPHTGFGYIRQGSETASGDDGIRAFDIAGFMEKPDFKTAKKFVDSKEYLWNSGIFICKAKVMLEAIGLHMPSLHASLSKIRDSGFDEQVVFEEFKQLESVSIDYGVMEKAGNTVVIRGDFPWDDIGDWKAMERVHAKDSRGNVVVGNHRGDARNCIIFGGDKIIETGNIGNLVVVDAKDALLVCSKDRVQDVKKIVELMQKDPKLEKYAVDVQDIFEPQRISIDCENIEAKSDGLVATIGVNDLSIEKNENNVIIRCLKLAE